MKDATPTTLEDALRSSTPTNSETANALAELYEESERIYRLAMSAGTLRSGVASRTDQTPI